MRTISIENGRVQSHAAWLSIVGFLAMVAGAWLVWGVGIALLGGGALLFLTGGLASAGERQRR